MQHQDGSLDIYVLKLWFSLTEVSNPGPLRNSTSGPPHPHRWIIKDYHFFLGLMLLDFHTSSRIINLLWVDFFRSPGSNLRPLVYKASVTYPLLHRGFLNALFSDLLYVGCLILFCFLLLHRNWNVLQYSTQESTRPG